MPAESFIPVSVDYRSGCIGQSTPGGEKRYDPGWNAIGLGLANAVNRLKDSPGKSKVVILLTDGINNQGAIAPVTAAELAKAFGIRVYTIGVGTYGEAPYPVPTPFGVQLQNMPVEIDEGVLQQLLT